MNVDNPTSFAGLLAVGVEPIVTLAAKSREVFVTAQPLTNPARLVVEIGCFFTLAAFTLWVEGKVRLFLLCILIVFTLAFFRCSPQPIAALQGSF
jgi:hypothetical protein